MFDQILEGSVEILDRFALVQFVDLRRKKLLQLRSSQFRSCLVSHVLERFTVDVNVVHLRINTPYSLV